MTKRILFLCTANSCRSQMAEGIAKGLGDVEAMSAGSQSTEVNPRAVQVMQEIGIDISGQRSKSLDEFMGQRFDYVITLCGDTAKDACPAFIGDVGERLHWNFSDPVQAKGAEEEVLAVFRKVRDEIAERIHALATTEGWR